MRNEDIDKKISELEHQLHLERREDRKVLNDSLSKLTHATTELTITVRELSITKDVVNQQISELRVDVADVSKAYNRVDKSLAEIKAIVETDIRNKNARVKLLEENHLKLEGDFSKRHETLKNEFTIKYESLNNIVSMMKPVVESNNRAKENAQNKIMDIGWKVIQFGIMGGILYKVSLGG